MNGFDNYPHFDSQLPLCPPNSVAHFGMWNIEVDLWGLLNAKEKKDFSLTGMVHNG
jgi:hypothetical protein